MISLNLLKNWEKEISHQYIKFKELQIFEDLLSKLFQSKTLFQLKMVNKVY
jgi:hypothetical protein